MVSAQRSRGRSWPPGQVALLAVGAVVVAGAVLTTGRGAPLPGTAAAGPVSAAGAPAAAIVPAGGTTTGTTTGTTAAGGTALAGGGTAVGGTTAGGTVAGVPAFPPGTYAVTPMTVPAGAVPGFAGGTVYVPDAPDRRGAVVVAPDAQQTQAAVAWIAPRVAAHGMVVFTVDVQDPADQAPARGRQMLAAMEWLTTASPVAGRIDPARLAVMGHGAGGGGAFEAARQRPMMKAVVALNPSATTTMANVPVPALVVGSTADAVAPVAQQAFPIYRSVPAGVPKVYVELAGADHATLTRDDEAVGNLSVAMLKRFVDGDARASVFLCPPAPGPGFTVTASTCPF